MHESKLLTATILLMLMTTLCFCMVDAGINYSNQMMTQFSILFLPNTVWLLEYQNILIKCPHCNVFLRNIQTTQWLPNVDFEYLLNHNIIIIIITTNIINCRLPST